MLKRKNRYDFLRRLAGLCLPICMAVTLVPPSIVSAASNSETIALLESEISRLGLEVIGKVTEIKKDKDVVNIKLSTGESIRISFLEDNVFRLYMDPKGEFQEYPTPNAEDHTTKIIDKELDEYKSEYGVIDVNVDDSDSKVYKISTNSIELRIDKETSIMELYDKVNDKVVWSEAKPLMYSDKKTVQTLKTKNDEYFYGGGQQNGYFSHKNTSINIAIGGGWDAGAASSPSPFYISTEGYGVMRNTFKPGKYDFFEEASLSHDEGRFDAYYFVGGNVPNVIESYTELTGRPAMMPEYGFYLGHADCFNGTHNGLGDDRELLGKGLDTLKSYGTNDMPLGWFLPNDGYGCGYGGLDNLEKFVNAAKEENVNVGLWTQSNLYPDESLPEDSPLRRDLDGEVKAGVRAIKTDVAWVGYGYSMALNATRQAAEGIEKEENSGGARPFVISLDGWAGTQRYAGLWSGDQYGGNWEYIRMHIPTYIGSGLSGNPNVGSDMDGIFGGAPVIQTRDFQWKAFTPIQIDMDGWAGTSNKKTPWNYGEPYASINRMYLKLKAEMMPYIYTNAAESSKTGLPMVRAMMLEYPDDPYTYGTQTQYQYMWGPNLLVAPVYNEEDNNNNVRNGIYLPDEDQIWIDYFTGEQYKGGQVINNFDAPLWKAPVFVKNGAIIPMAPENNSINELDGSENRIFDVYPSGSTEFTMYEDDGKTIDYKEGKNTTTKVTSEVNGESVKVTVNKAEGKGYEGMVANRGTEVIINTRKAPEKVTVKVGGKNVELTPVTSEEDYNNGENVYFYNEKPNLNKYSTEGSEFAKQEIITSPKLYVKVGKTDITKNSVEVNVDGFDNTQIKEEVDSEIPSVPTNLVAQDENITDTAITLNWNKVNGENVSYDLMIDGTIYSNIFTNTNGEEPFFTHKDLTQDTAHTYRVRATNTKGSSEWSEELTVKTKLDRYRNVPKNMTATADSYQPGSGPENAVDGKDNTQWHTEWGTGNVLPHTFTIDMKLAYQLDKFEYTPRQDSGNGTITKYDLDVSLDGKTYVNIVKDGKWDRSADVKTVDFGKNVYARYIKLTIKEAVGGFGSAQEFRPYMVDGTKGQVVGENIPNGVIDDDDLTFFASYMGVNKDDTAWDQVSKVDINYNGVIDAYDLAYVAGQLGESPLVPTGIEMKGVLNIRPSKKELKSGEEFTVEIVGQGLQDINAFNLEMILDPHKYEVVKECNADGTCGTTVVSATEATDNMLNYSILAGVGKPQQRIFAAFSNKGNGKTLNGSNVLAKIKLKAKQDITFDMEISDSLLVDTSFNVITKKGIVLDPDTEIPEEKPEYIKLTNEDMTVSGDGSMMQGGDAAFGKLIDGVVSEDSLAELIWNNTEESGKKLPLSVDFKFNKPQSISNITVFNRPQYTNGKIKKLSIKGFGVDGTEYDLGTKTVEPNEAYVKFDIDPINELSKVQVVFEESHSGPLMLSVAEVEFIAKTNNEPEKPSVDKTALENKIKEAEAIDLSKYTDETVNVFKEKLNDAKAVRDDAKATQEAVNNALQSLNDSIKALEEKPVQPSVDKTALENKIKEAEAIDLSKYTDETVNVFKEKLNDAKAVRDDAKATQEAVNNALQSLNDSIKALEEKPVQPSVDKTALENKIKEAEAIDLAKYTDKSVSEFNEKLSIAKEVLANEASSQDEVNKALEDLNKAIDKLEVKEESSKPSKPSEPSEPSNPSGDSSDGETVKTGDTQGSKILLFGSLAIIAGVAGVYFRKKKTVE